MDKAKTFTVLSRQISRSRNIIRTNRSKKIRFIYFLIFAPNLNIRFVTSQKEKTATQNLNSGEVLIIRNFKKITAICSALAMYQTVCF